MRSFSKRCPAETTRHGAFGPGGPASRAEMGESPGQVADTFAVMATAMLVEACGAVNARILADRWARKNLSSSPGNRCSRACKDCRRPSEAS
jgi:hypothetical protein